MNALQMFIIMTRSNKILTALNTNCVGVLISGSAGRLPDWYRMSVHWLLSNSTTNTTCDCFKDLCTSPAGFYADLANEDAQASANFRPQRYNFLDPLLGFLGACTPVEAILQATFACLYRQDCILTLINYFPRLTEVRPMIDILVEDASHSLSDRCSR